MYPYSASFQQVESELGLCSEPSFFNGIDLNDPAILYDKLNRTVFYAAQRIEDSFDYLFFVGGQH
jgi:hypothetical protein